MGDRVSIRFTNKEDKDAPVIFCHWGGLGFVEAAVRYSQDLIEERKGGIEPLDRLEPRTVTCDFLYNVERYYPINLGGKDFHRISHDIYMGINENDGDNGDNGHFDIDLSDVDKLNTFMADIADRYNDPSWG
jgi:hypothetical protein